MVKIPQEDRIKSAIVATAGSLLKASPANSPEETLGELLADVQHNHLYDDSKTFVDLVPRKRMKQIQQEYLLEKNDPDFDLRDFVSRHFYRYGSRDTGTYRTNPDMPVREHIKELWSVLERRNRRNRGSLIALPYPYVVPGGRFSEQFYWDSYFIMLGLAADGRWDMVESMVKNFAYLIRTYGYIPSANRTYLLSRSQPPFFALMVKLLARHKGRRTTLLAYLPYMVLEYRFWMKGRHELTARDHHSYNRVVQMPNGVLMNRYYDNKSLPRPESLREDVLTAGEATDRVPDRLYLHLRAAAESGWDFSSRWFRDADDIRTIHTADIIPVDLNCLLYILESSIAEAYRSLLQPALAKRFQAAADRRQRTILEYNWNNESEFFEDYNFHLHHQTGRLTLAGVFPLYAKIATGKQAEAVAKRIERQFLKEGGLVATLEDTGQQWDAPNGWAPLHWIVIEGLRNYGYYDLAKTIKARWLKTNLRIYHQEGKLVEKYNVVTPSLGSGGEYPLQDGFGWTNGVLAALLDEPDISTGT